MADLARSFLVLGLLIATVPSLGHALLSRKPKTSVEIQNVLEGRDDLTIHCKSKDDDLGVQYLKPRENFSFRFRPNIFGTTLFFCSFAWKGGVCRWFDIYEHDRDEHCTKCTWQIFKEGPCRFTVDDYDYGGEHGVVDELCYDWNPDRC
ncbi:hypothetical protein PIB30_066014 [Stylosanthes scabra]|uniref:S-protein homolog n=1 Tax=Stylosanthes scabra TaxID=79078 RepID=A0ABU6XN42_9FABA|nr:hypothetical protein [Stylosanthes scabra]